MLPLRRVRIGLEEQIRKMTNVCVALQILGTLLLVSFSFELYTERADNKIRCPKLLPKGSLEIWTP